MKPHSRFETARRILLFWTLFIAIGAIGGAAGMLYDPTGRWMGMDAMLPYFQLLPAGGRQNQRDRLYSGASPAQPL